MTDAEHEALKAKVVQLETEVARLRRIAAYGRGMATSRVSSPTKNPFCGVVVMPVSVEEYKP